MPLLTGQKKKTTRREQFLARMDALIPWEELEAEIAPFYPRRGQGRPPYPLAVMLRVSDCSSDTGSQLAKQNIACSEPLPLAIKSHCGVGLFYSSRPTFRPMCTI